MTVMGDASMDGLSDAGSIPARSTKNTAYAVFLFYKAMIFGGRKHCLYFTELYERGKGL